MVARLRHGFSERNGVKPGAMKAVFVLGPALLCAAAGEDRLSITLLLDTNPPWLDYLRAEKNAAIEFFDHPLGSLESAALARFDYQFRIAARTDWGAGTYSTVISKKAN